jgi:tetratricopeptide (TPR) repeat protein
VPETTSQPRTTALISSSVADLPGHLDQVRAACERQGLALRLVEHADEDAQVRREDVAVLVVLADAAPTPAQERLIQLARAAGLPVVVLGREGTSIAALRAALVDALAPHRPPVHAFHHVQAPPAPPEPWLAHPYPLLGDSPLIGRQRELDRLDAWVADPNAPRVRCVRGVGGMGKSALTWTWFHGQDAAPWQGRLWWSFYESDATFDNFVLRALAYVVGTSIAEAAAVRASERLPRLLQALAERPFLVVFDGFERQLNGYARGEDVSPDMDEPRWQRVALDPQCDAFLRRLCAPGASRVLLTSRLVPAALQEADGSPRPGSEVVELAGLDEVDTVAFWRSLGVTGTRFDLGALSAALEHHPLLLRVVAGEIRHHPTARGDLSAWQRAGRGFNPDARGADLLEQALSAVPVGHRHVLALLAAFHVPVPWARLVTLLVGRGHTCRRPSALDEVLSALEERGVLGWDRAGNRYDLHPVVRGATWHALGPVGRRLVTRVAKKHLETKAPEVDEQVRSLDDLTGAIELVRLSLGLGQYDEAFRVYREHLHDRMTRRLHLCREASGLLEQLFVDGLDQPPKLAGFSEQQAAMHHLSYASHFGGRPGLAWRIERALLEQFPASSTHWHNLATAALACRDDLREVEAAFRSALRAGRGRQDHDTLASAVGLASLRSMMGQVELAECLAERCAMAYAALEPDEHAFSAWAVVGEIAIERGDRRGAELAMGLARMLVDTARVQRCKVTLKELEAAFALRFSRREDARRLYASALAEARRLRLPSVELTCSLALAREAMDQGEFDAAGDLLDDAEAIAERGPYAFGSGLARVQRARWWARGGRPDEALGALVGARDLACRRPPPFQHLKLLGLVERQAADLGLVLPPSGPFIGGAVEPALLRLPPLPVFEGLVGLEWDHG